MHQFVLTTESLLLGGVIGYLIGSIPFAYLITRRHTGKDLRREGTGNIGTANAFDVTGSRRVGASVLAADVLKGLVPVLLFELLGLREPLLVLIPALVLGHCYPIWLRFHGGRGLATAAGAALMIGPLLVAFWLFAYFLARRIRDHVHFGAIVATGASLAATLLVPVPMLERTLLPISGLTSFGDQTILALSLVLLIILSRHIQPFVALVKGQPAD